VVSHGCLRSSQHTANIPLGCGRVRQRRQSGDIWGGATHLSARWPASCLPCEPALFVVRLLGCAASLSLQTHIASQSAASQGAAPSSLPVKKERPSDLSSLPGRPFSRLAGFLRVCSYAWIRVLSDVPKPLATSRLGGDEWV